MASNELLATHAQVIARARASQQEHRRVLSNLPSPPQSVLSLPLLPSPPPSPPESPPAASGSGSTTNTIPQTRVVRADLSASKRARVARYANYVPEEETIRNDYSQRYVDSGEWPQNWVQGAEPERRFEEYPKQQKLLALKKNSVAHASAPPWHIPQAHISSLPPAKFDVILIDPPFSSSFSWETLSTLPIPSLAADPSFVFLWVGSGAGEGLERGREVLAKWGYRRCEDVVWVKTNKTSNNGPGTDPPTTSLLTRTKQHCLMGIRGTVRRSTDSWFVHCNIDTDVIIWEGDPTDPTKKPPEMYTLIENFCLGARRLEVFGRPYSLRPGWVTAGDFELTQSLAEETGARSFEHEQWDRELPRDINARYVVTNSQEIEILRPKSPVRGGAGQSQPSASPHPSQGLNAPQNIIGISGLPQRPIPNSNNRQGNMMTNMGAPAGVATFSGGVALGLGSGIGGPMSSTGGPVPPRLQQQQQQQQFNAQQARAMMPGFEYGQFMPQQMMNPMMGMGNMGGGGMPMMMGYSAMGSGYDHMGGVDMSMGGGFGPGVSGGMMPGMYSHGGFMMGQGGGGMMGGATPTDFNSMNNLAMMQQGMNPQMQYGQNMGGMMGQGGYNPMTGQGYGMHGMNMGGWNEGM
ncbi:hypothetical protein FRC02_009713 [Tulasnella sp. 418]|nr:hypothetical protein FRC02_009713 [Tulasnella sp. 418]